MGKFVGIRLTYNNRSLSSLHMLKTKLLELGRKNLSADMISYIRTGRFTTGLTNFIRKAQKSVFEEIKEQIIARWWQYDWNLNPKTGRPIYHTDTRMSPGASPWGGVNNPDKSIYEVLLDLDIIFDEKTSYKDGINFSASLDFSELTEASLARSGSSEFVEQFEYWLLQEFGGSVFGKKHFEGKHFLFSDEEGNLNNEDKKKLDGLKAAISRRLKYLIIKKKAGG